MLYVPRHFFTNNHVAVEEALGQDAYAEILYKAGYKSAYHWCDKEAALHGLSGMAVFEHYLNRLSQRGWGLFKIIEADPASARAASSCAIPPSCCSSPRRSQALLHVRGLVRRRDGLGQRHHAGRARARRAPSRPRRIAPASMPTITALRVEVSPLAA